MRRDLAAVIDHSCLRADATRKDFERVCAEARHFGFAAVCVNSAHVSLCTTLVEGALPIASTVGFPLGASSPAAKSAEARQAVRDGASEIDMVLPIGALKEGQYERVRRDIEAVVAATDGHPVKVILETCLLSDEEKRRGAELCVQAGACFVKTSTGFGSAGATEADVRLLREVVGPDFGVKASAGIRDAETATRMIAAGADRLGTSAGVTIVTEGEE
jgi:deoxyribose-phosphate aldolase